MKKQIIDGCITVIDDNDNTYMAYFDEKESALYQYLTAAEDDKLVEIISNPGLMNAIKRTGAMPEFPFFGHGHRVHYVPCDERGMQNDKRVYLGMLLKQENVLELCSTYEEAQQSLYYDGVILQCCPECKKVYKTYITKDDGEVETRELKEETVFEV